ncbi:uncharacterized protein LOC131053732 isoform X2 [Cryptomeria japonica]|uniref:uncharacterized protein LOC131053732 isoform X2 n=1 Tax=Cryptomeria japonica TaxID=3369 RepID=UPI0027DA32BB|nr:uncharacterized protein LOC131053732 isoform X2 [Cryptomeria japonica]
MTNPSSMSFSNHISIDGSSENEIRPQLLESQYQQTMVFHQTADQRHEDSEVPQHSGWGQLHDYKIESSLQHPSSTTDAIGEARQVTWGDIMQVKHFVETCIKSYMTKNEVVKALSTHAKIDPCFTHLVWQRLERENNDFFRKYYIWLKVKEQILLFNHLLEQQHQVMVMESALDFQQSQLQTNMQPHVVSSELANQLMQHNIHSSHVHIGADKVDRVTERPTPMHSSIFDSTSMSNVDFNQGSAMFGNEAFFSNPSMLSGTPYTNRNMVDLNGDGFLHMGSLEGMPGTTGQSSIDRSMSDLRTVFQPNQGSFSGPSFSSSSMGPFLSTPFQNTGERRTVGPIAEPMYDSYEDKDLDDYIHMVQGRQQ